MLTNQSRRMGLALLLAASGGYGCNAQINSETGASGGSTGSGTGNSSGSGKGGGASPTGAGGANVTGAGGTSPTGAGGSAVTGTGGASSTGTGGTSSPTGTGGMGVISPDAGSNADAGGVNVKPTTFTPALAGPTCRKIKDLLVGMPCTADEVSTVESSGPAGLQQLIINWETSSTYQPML